MKEKITNIPEKPGCYIYLDSSKKIIYVGKAKNLKKRVSSYFSKKHEDEKTKVLVEKIKDIDFIVTDSEVEAMILENNLIKKNSPKYNINLKDSKSFAYIELTKEEFPRFLVLRAEKLKNKKDHGKIFGPFVSADSRDKILDLLNKTFKIRTCKKLPKKKCIRYDLGICSAPCINKISKKDYLEDVTGAINVLKGNYEEVEKNLFKKMKNFSEKKDFEKALETRKKIEALDYLNQTQKMQRDKNYDEDILNYIVKNEKVYLILFQINKGILENKKSFEFDYKEDFLEEFLMQYYSENKIPKKLFLPEKNDLVEKYLSKLKNSKVEVINPKKGELRGLLNLVEENVEIHFFGNMKKVEELKKVLNLKENPEVIECFDVSHLGGTEVVASMVQFRNGKPDKRNYRKFKVRAPDKNDDFAAMNEVVKRRYLRLKNENKSFPNLILIDGGKGQLNSSIEALKEIDVKIPIISLAKKFEEVYLPGNSEPLKISEKNKARLFLEQIRDEAHRFAVKYQRERRKKSYFK